MITCAALLYSYSSCNGACTWCGASDGARVVRMLAMGQRVVKPTSLLTVGHRTIARLVHTRVNLCEDR